MLRDGEEAVVLTESECRLAAAVGMERTLESRFPKDRDGKPLPPRVNNFPLTNECYAWGQDAVGAQAECAFAKSIGAYWCAGVKTFRIGGDVLKYEVRWNNGRYDFKTKRQFPPTMKVRADEFDSTIVVAVSGTAPNFVVHGWLRARQAKRPEWLSAPQEGKPAYFVPLESLAPMYTLPGRSGAVEAS
jgi:hypothetical protein